jgi:galactokinase/mevalonate kinase-like predicted kinase
MSERERKIPVQCYLSDDENFILQEKFKLSKMKSKSAFLRHLILYGFVYDVDYTELRKYNNLLANIANNLNQISKRANTTGHLYEEDIKEVKELMNNVWHTQKSMLSKQPSIKQ